MSANVGDYSLLMLGRWASSSVSKRSRPIFRKSLIYFGTIISARSKMCTIEEQIPYSLLLDQSYETPT